MAERKAKKSESRDIAAQAVEQIQDLMDRPIEAVTGIE